MNEAASQPVLDGIAIVNGDKRSVAYRPQFARLTGSATAAVLLQQIMFRWDSNGNEAFYKFKSPCSHDKYRPGDSWCEELAFTESEFDNAIAKIGTKITKGLSKQAAFDFKMPRIEDFKGFEDAYEDALVIAVQHSVIYWTDGGRVTWYAINRPILNELILMVYGAKPEILVYLDKSRNRSYLGKRKKRVYLSSESNRDNSKNIPPKAAAPVPDLKVVKKMPEVKEVRSTQDHMLPIEAWCLELNGSLPTTFKMGAFARVSKEWHASGITPDNMTCAAQLFKAWLAAHPGAPVVNWQVNAMRGVIDGALALCRMGIVPNDVTAFVKEQKSQEFWKGKVVSFDYVKNNLPTWKIERSPTESPAPDLVDDPDNPGVKIPRSKLAARERNKKLIEAEYGKTA